MEIVIIIIMCLVSFSLMLKLTYLPTKGVFLIALLCALFTGFSWESAVEQSKTQIADWLQNPELMLDMAVLLTIDVLLQISFCIFNAEYIAGDKLSKTAKILRRVTLWIPGILIFPTLYALLVEVIFSCPGVDFATIAWTLAVVVLTIGMVLPLGIKLIIPERDLRLELMFMVNALIALLGVVATVNGRTAVTGTNSIDLQALVGVIGLLLIGALIGLIIFKFKKAKIAKIAKIAKKS